MSPARAKRRDPRTSAEWVTFGVSAALLAVLAGLIVMQIPGEHTPAAPTARVAGAVRSSAGTFYVPVEVENRGEETAQNVQVMATLTAPDGTEITADQTIDFLAGGERESVQFAFDRDPDEGELEVVVSGYGEP